MAVMTTILEVLSDNGNTRTFAAPTHTTAKPFLVIQQRKAPVGNSVIAEDIISLRQNTTDVNGDALPERISMAVTVRRPITGSSVDLNATRDLFREIVNSDEFDVLLEKSFFIQG